jgi:hypothetical protein
MNHSQIKPIAAGVTAMALDRFYFNENDGMRSLKFGVFVAGGVLASELIAPNIMPDLPSLNKELYNGKQLALRITEVASASIGVFVVNKYITGNDIYGNEMFARLGAIAISDVVGEFAADYLTNQPLAFLE